MDSEETPPVVTVTPHCPQIGPSSCRKTISGLLLMLHDGELCNYFIIYHNTVIMRTKCTRTQCAQIILSPSTHLGPWKNCLPQNWSLGPKRLGTADLAFHLTGFHVKKKSCHFFQLLHQFCLWLGFIQNISCLTGLRDECWEEARGPRFPPQQWPRT